MASRRRRTTASPTKATARTITSRSPAALDVFGGRGHLILGGEYENQKEIGDCFTRSYCLGGTVITNTGVGAVAGQPTLVRNAAGGGFFANPNGVISVLNNNTAATAGIRNLFGTGGVTFRPDGTPIAYNLGRPASGSTAANGDVFSAMTTTQLMVPVERYTTYGHMDFDVSANVRGFVEGSFGHVEGETLQSRWFGAAVPIFTDNPFIPAAVRTAGALAPASANPNATRPGNSTASFNLATLGQRRGHSGSEADTYRGTFGFNGALSGSWKWDAYYQYAHTERDQFVENNLVQGAPLYTNVPNGAGLSNPSAVARWFWSLDSVYNPADAALPAAQRRVVCRASISADAALRAAASGCVPFNPFGENSSGQAALDYVYQTLTENIEISQHVVAGNVTGEIAQLWAGPLSAAAGVEYRHDETELKHDDLSNVFAYFQNFGADYNAEQDVVEGYLEAELPLLKDVTAARNLSLNAAVRETRYDISGFGGFNRAAADSSFNATTWKVGLLWDPVEWLRFRLTKSRDVRAPNFNELFQASASNFTSVFNSLVAGRPSQNPTLYGGGNPDVQPEKGDTTTVGVIFTPRWGGWTDGVRLSVDYYNIKVDDYIGSPGTQNIVDRCATGDTALCNLLVLGAGNSLLEVRNVNFNLQWLRTRGIDIEAEYKLPMGLSFRALATRTLENSTNLFGVVTDRMGETGGAGLPKWLANLYTTYAKGPASLTLSARYISKGILNALYTDPSSPNFSLTAPNNINDNSVASVVYFNLSGSYNFVEHDDVRIQAFAAVNNLFNRAPPSAPQLSYPTNPIYFDQIGRIYRAGVRFSF